MCREEWPGVDFSEALTTTVYSDLGLWETMLKEIQAQNSAPPASYQTQAFLGVQAAFDSNLESHQWLHRHRRCRWNLWLGFPLACHVD